MAFTNTYSVMYFSPHPLSFNSRVMSVSPVNSESSQSEREMKELSE